MFAASLLWAALAGVFDASSASSAAVDPELAVRRRPQAEEIAKERRRALSFEILWLGSVPLGGAAPGDDFVDQRTENAILLRLELRPELFFSLPRPSMPRRERERRQRCVRLSASPTDAPIAAALAIARAEVLACGGVE